MKLFQIEEPDGSPAEQDGPGAAVGAAVGIDIAPVAGGAVAFAVAGNAELLPGRNGDRRLAAPGLGQDGSIDENVLADLLLGLRERAEKQLARPVTHAVIVLQPTDGAPLGGRVIEAAARRAGLTVLRLLDQAAAAALAGAVCSDDAAALGAARQAEDDAFALGAH